MSHYGHHLATIMLFETNRNDMYKSNLAAAQNVSTAGKHFTFCPFLGWTITTTSHCGFMEKSNLGIMQKNKKNPRFQTWVSIFENKKTNTQYCMIHDKCNGFNGRQISNYFVFIMPCQFHSTSFACSLNRTQPILTQAW